MFIIRAVKPLMLIALMAGSLQAYAKTATITKPEKLTIAVMKIQANNCEPSIARAVSEMLIGRIFETGAFRLLERGQMDLILRENEVDEKGCIDTECAARIGRMLSVKKMIMGSVNRLGDYRVEIRVIDVSSGSVDLSVSMRTSAESEFDKIIDKIVFRIKSFYSGMTGLTGDYDITLSASIIFPFGDFTRGASIGYGSTIAFSINEPFMKNINILFSAGYYYFTTRLESIDSLMMAPLRVSAACPINVSDSFRFAFSAGAGYIFSRLRYDRVEDRTDSNYQYKTGYYYNPMVTAGIDIDLLLGNRWHLAIFPSYSAFFESGRAGHLISLDFGLRMMF
jgi:hypothetical protein